MAESRWPAATGAAGRCCYFVELKVSEQLQFGWSMPPLGGGTDSSSKRASSCSIEKLSSSETGVSGVFMMNSFLERFWDCLARTIPARRSESAPANREGVSRISVVFAQKCALRE